MLDARWQFAKGKGGVRHGLKKASSIVLLQWKDGKAIAAVGFPARDAGGGRSLDNNFQLRTSSPRRTNFWLERSYRGLSKLVRWLY